MLAIIELSKSTGAVACAAFSVAGLLWCTADAMIAAATGFPSVVVTELTVLYFEVMKAEASSDDCCGGSCFSTAAAGGKGGGGGGGGNCNCMGAVGRGGCIVSGNAGMGR